MPQKEMSNLKVLNKTLMDVVPQKPYFQLKLSCLPHPNPTKLMHDEISKIGQNSIPNHDVFKGFKNNSFEDQNENPCRKAQ